MLVDSVSSNFLKSLISANNFSVYSFGFSKYKLMSSTNKQCCFCISNHYIFYLFFLLYWVSQNLHIILSRNNSCSDLKNIFNIITIKQYVCWRFSRDTLCQIEKISSICSLLTLFENHKWLLNLPNIIFCTHWDDCVIFLLFINLINNSFSNVVGIADKSEFSKLQMRHSKPWGSYNLWAF